MGNHLASPFWTNRSRSFIGRMVPAILPFRRVCDPGTCVRAKSGAADSSIVRSLNNCLAAQERAD